MRLMPAILSAVVTTGLVVLFNTQLPVGTGKTPRLGYFLSPQTGFWQNAEAVDADFCENISLLGINAKAEVLLDDRLVPHVYAETDADAYFVQGYLHAKFRLWQMEFQTHIAGGRLSEIQGEAGLKIDKYFRRLGMVYGAENSMKELEKDPEIKAACDAYTAGVNAYINQLNPKDYPLEYKLLDYKPENWTNLKTCLFLKFMSFDLSGQGDDDLLATNTKNFFGYELYQQLFPLAADSLDPILPKGTQFAQPTVKTVIPASFDSLYIGKADSFSRISPIIPDKNNGSNNWAVSGSKTASGRPILCNDPHLGLNLPSLWYEIQITTPTSSSYGVSFPGSPCVIIGFNDSASWGVTNAGRDVKDFYRIQFKDSTMLQYQLNGNWQTAAIREEVIKVKGGADVVEKMAITNFGPVMYDAHYPAAEKSTANYALRWKAHDGSNELRTFYKLNRAKNLADYNDATKTFECPGQNFLFATKTNTIALRQQGKFVAKWKHQGEFIMPADTAYSWQGYVPFEENYAMINPERGFVSSANQMAYDTSFPYYLGMANDFPVYRGLIINKKLTAMQNITVADMKQLQTNNEDAFAQMAKPFALALIKETDLSKDELKYFTMLKTWNAINNIDEKGPSIFKMYWDSLKAATWGDEYEKSSLPLLRPENVTLIEALIKKGDFVLADDINTPNVKETMPQIALIAFKKAAKAAADFDAKDELTWGKFKDTRVSHLTKLDALSRLHLPIGGGANVINATTSVHGPSWRMIVHMTDDIEAFGVYPGGQNGNPGSKFYDAFIDSWAKGEYYPLLFLSKEQLKKHRSFKWTMSFQPKKA